MWWWKKNVIRVCGGYNTTKTAPGIPKRKTKTENRPPKLQKSVSDREGLNELITDNGRDTRQLLM